MNWSSDQTGQFFEHRTYHFSEEALENLHFELLEDDLYFLHFLQFKQNNS